MNSVHKVDTAIFGLGNSSLKFSNRLFFSVLLGSEQGQLHEKTWSYTIQRGTRSISIAIIVVVVIIVIVHVLLED